MRFRFSLRTLVLLLGLLAGVCYLWLTRPSQLAQRFADAINTENFQEADRLFFHADDEFLADWAERRWAFRARCDVRPWTLSQLLTARRHVDVHIDYFEHDHSASRHAEITATPLGMAAPTMSSVSYGGQFFDEVRESQLPIEPQWQFKKFNK
jgi:hypothetical protein